MLGRFSPLLFPSVRCAWGSLDRGPNCKLDHGLVPKKQNARNRSQVGFPWHARPSVDGTDRGSSGRSLLIKCALATAQR